MIPDPSRRQALAFLGGEVLAASSAFAQPKKKPIKIGQIGVAHAHASKLSAYRQSADYEVVGIVEPDEKLRAAAQKQAAFRDLNWMTRDELLKIEGLQAVLIETRVRDLLNQTEACVNAGMHVHIDKPAGESLQQFRRIHETAARNKRIVQMGYMYRYNPGVVLLREFLSNGWLGEIFEVHAVMSKVIGAGERRNLAEYRGGLMFELGCHVLDLVIGVLGKPDSVTAFNKHSAPINDGLLDNMLAVLSYPRATATVKSSALEVEGFSRRHLVVCGTEGTFEIQPLDNPKVRLSLAKAQGKYKKGTQEITLPKYSRYIDDAADMARAIRGEQAFAFTAKHDLAVQESLLRACVLPLDR